MGKTVAAQPVRQWAHLDSIAEARRHSNAQERREGLRRAEASLNAAPINVTGQINAHMREQMAQGIEAKRAELAAIESLSGDALVERFCADILAQAQVPSVPLTLNGEAVARGALVQPIVPGMNTVRRV